MERELAGQKVESEAALEEARSALAAAEGRASQEASVAASTAASLQQVGGGVGVDGWVAGGGQVWCDDMLNPWVV